MFIARATAVKEGRSIRGPFRRKQRNLIAILMIGILTCLYFIATRSTPSNPLPGRGGRADAVATPSAQHPQDQTLHQPEMKRQPRPQQRPAQKEQVPITPDTDGDTELKEAQEIVDLAAPVAPAAPAAPSATSAQRQTQDDGTAAQEGWKGRPGVSASLRKMISLLPGEMQSRDYLRPVDGSGKEKLREMGLRARAFNGFFQAWEDLHMAEDSEGNPVVRDDVVQYLRAMAAKPSTPSSSSSSSSFSASASSSTAAEEEPAALLIPSYTLGSLMRVYEQYRYFLARFTQLLFPWNYPFHPDLLTLKSSFARGGRGIVLTAGDDQAPYLLTTIPSFRRLGCHLPIEVMYLGDSDLSEDFRADLEAMPGVVTRDMAQMVSDDGWKLAGWAAKPFAILLSSFREVIFIDADSAFFADPASLFADPAYLRTGALFFRDRLIMPESKKRWLQQVLPNPISRNVRQSRFWTGDSGHMQESGVVVVDKWKHFVALLLVTRMNGPDRDGDKGKGLTGVYDMMYGDKETFWIGWELVGDLAYSFHQGDAGTIGVLADKTNPDHPDHKDKQKAEEEEVEKSKPKPAQDENLSDEEKKKRKEEEDEKEKTKEQNAKPERYTMCSPQLLHLDLDGNPLWFNGWLLTSKFGDNKDKKFGTFKDYLIEPHGIRDPGQWQLGSSNMACLTTDAHLKRELRPEDLDMLHWLMKRAQEVGAPGSV